ncbi:MAG: F0F1 ATP synthase subunit alpha [Lachnospiraceae bacterium]|nr:F0F1 ATP synthase subunit alpha [Lachnospiraceae bacterium]
MSSIQAQDIISIIREEIENFDWDQTSREVGTVISVGDGIATIYGIDHAMYGEIVLFENGEKGMVQDIRRNEIGVILFGRDAGIYEGMKVSRTEKRAGIPVGDAFVGRVINALGEPIDGKGDIVSTGYNPIEREAPGIIDRQPVNKPLETGILAIDSMFPIGRGQRELIIGDRQTGKTSIAVDTILNQKGKDIICIYVAIGQKATTVGKVEHTLEEHGAMDYSIILSATAAEPASLQYVAPYAGTALGEYFMDQGRDVLIIYDDLSKHAVAYREISLLLGRSPGREAYPGDVFYLHSRLLERSSHLSDEKGGGSMTALPIIETQNGDVSAYISTNVISITDGQIFLETGLFFSGQRPAVNVGLSVSRVGGAAQTKAMKKASGSIRVDLAQYRELEVFTQFASDLDPTTKAELDHGSALMELLKQPLSHPMSMAEEVISLVLANHNFFDSTPKKLIKKEQAQVLDDFHKNHGLVISELTEKKALTEDLEQEIVEFAEDFRKEAGQVDTSAADSNDKKADSEGSKDPAETAGDKGSQSDAASDHEEA